MQSGKDGNTSTRSEEKRGVCSVVTPERCCHTSSKSNDDAFFAGHKKFAALFEGMLNACAYCRIMYEQGVAVDFMHEAVNPAFSKFTGLHNLAGLKCSEVLPTLHTTTPELLE